ncbi:O-phosphoseryl-tRNA(Sec) selenium transferase [Plasmodium brasilianum]|uniref:O-phosphoseryl-tRNA(Sec) selenium transferase n=2 Tax=Plasmodium (Plasmodium) TaxID=418103 RepID=A0A1D3TC97_PLAMA|nr:O-phosphoseryl-tRNA(Sec) selenium transferase, putative [Plasmodium malariae]KAI4835579.1 O-phosphoseryl-tRNA(Sec) selenium transferase [Plasmodium brasilianum]SCP02504.1 O-phosphoseryl-tRNA(Sec) selenium transferase, putative [Plasmodium malariae]
MHSLKEKSTVGKLVRDGVHKNKYSLISEQTLNQKENILSNILTHGRIPDEGLNEITIMHILHKISSQNLCNSEKNVKIGERENRIYSALVRSKYIGFGHGIGRSGNLDDVQPKSAGNSILAKATTRIVKDLIKDFGIRSCQDVYILPYATGMCISTCLLYIKKERIDSEYVIISRIDHKTCYKCIEFCNLKYIVVDMIFKDEQLYTDIENIKNLMDKYKEKICCVISVTASYAPRNCDDIINISLLCKKYNMPHIINNSFGLQCNYICKEIQRCYNENGRIDFVVQSCDKNFLVPVNGGIVFSGNKKKMNELKKTYPGRTPVHAYLDLLITLLELGKTKIMKLRKERIENFNWFKEKIYTLCSKYNLSLIKTSKNTISMAINLNELYKYCGLDDPKKICLLGSFLFYRNVTGHRVICSPLLIKNYILKKIKEKREVFTTESDRNFHSQCSDVHTEEQGSNPYSSVRRGNSIQDSSSVINPVSSAVCNQVSLPISDHSKNTNMDPFCHRTIEHNEELTNNKITISNKLEVKQVDNDFEKLNEKNTLKIGNHIFQSFGTSYDLYPFSYIAFSCVIGIEKEELQSFVQKLDDAIDYFIRKFKRKEKEKNISSHD